MQDMARKTFFDISACKSLNFGHRACKLNSVPVAECLFLIDQKSERCNGDCWIRYSSNEGKKKETKTGKSQEVSSSAYVHNTSIIWQLALE